MPSPEEQRASALRKSQAKQMSHPQTPARLKKHLEHHHGHEGASELDKVAAMERHTKAHSTGFKVAGKPEKRHHHEGDESEHIQAAQRVMALHNDRRGYNPLSDPQSSYNNPKKGPLSSGAPGGGIPLRGPLTSEQDTWMKKGRKK